MIGQIKTNNEKRQIKMSYICRSCGEIIRDEWRDFGPEYVFGDMCPECKAAEERYADVQH